VSCACVGSFTFLRGPIKTQLWWLLDRRFKRCPTLCLVPVLPVLYFCATQSKLDCAACLISALRLSNSASCPCVGSFAFLRGPIKTQLCFLLGQRFKRCQTLCLVPVLVVLDFWGAQSKLNCAACLTSALSVVKLCVLFLCWQFYISEGPNQNSIVLPAWIGALSIVKLCVLFLCWQFYISQGLNQSSIALAAWSAL